MGNRKLAISLALGALAAAYAGYRRLQRRGARSAAKPEYLQTWEGEGGGLPVSSAAEIGPRHPARGLEDESFGRADGSASSVIDGSATPFSR